MDRMIEILASPDHVVAMKLSGTVSGHDYDRVVAEVDAKLDGHDRIGVLVDLTGFEDMTLEAGAKDARYGLRRLWELKRFPREAVRPPPCSLCSCCFSPLMVRTLSRRFNSMSFSSRPGASAVTV